MGFWRTMMRSFGRGIRGSRSRWIFLLAVFWIRGIRLRGRSIAIPGLRLSGSFDSLGVGVRKCIKRGRMIASGIA